MLSKQQLSKSRKKAEKKQNKSRNCSRNKQENDFVSLVLFFFCGMTCVFFVFCGMNCVFLCALFCGMNCVFFLCFFFVVWLVFFWCIFVVWIVFFLMLFLWYDLWLLEIENKLNNIFNSQFQDWTGWKRAGFVFCLCFFVVLLVCFFVLFLWYDLWFLFVLFLWSDLFFIVVWLVFFVLFCGMTCVFLCVFFCGMTCVCFCVFSVVWLVSLFVLFLWYDLCFFVVWIVFFLCFFVVWIAHKKISISLEKMKLTQAAWPRQPSDQRPSKCLTPFPFSNLLSKRISQEWAHARSGNVKKCNYISHDVYWGPQQLLLEARLCNALLT